MTKERGSRRRGSSIFDWMRSDDVSLNRFRTEWQADCSRELLRAVWRGYDELIKNELSGLPVCEVDEEIERSITQLIEHHIRDQMSGYESFEIQHGSYEFATRKRSPAQPPQYDLAFYHRDRPQIMWPLEAKVLRSDLAIGRYVQDIRTNFLTGRYAPYVTWAAMLGYLVKGNPEVVFTQIEQSLDTCLAKDPVFSDRDHRVSYHIRTDAAIRVTGNEFRCHHLVMVFDRIP